MPTILSEPADLIKIFILAWIGVYLINMALRKMGLATYTTTGN